MKRTNIGLDHLVKEGHAVVPPQVGSKSFFGMPQMIEFLKLYANNPDYKVFEVSPLGISEINDFNRH
ncbi:hypothetical protein [Paenibacillus sonchi]|uniref:hypothetical protein n=1 Tax=Paenibacillus sonchi TaxID=373687 RepID=UPI0002E8C798|nr:hypothetical protein [Paenibacillus sonchi]